jgi:hypothetical protein
MPDHHNVYVIELDPAVFREKRRFANANPQFDPASGKPCVYVGCTGRTPEERFCQHKKGIKACSYVRDYGLRLRPRLYARFNPMPYKEAAQMEVELGRRLRKRGYAVWQK